MSKDYSLPDCPRIGKYDGLGMAAVPLAIRDKERERGYSVNQTDIDEKIKKLEKDISYKEGYEAGYLDANKKLFLIGVDDTKLDDMFDEAEKYVMMNDYDFWKVNQRTD